MEENNYYDEHEIDLVEYLYLLWNNKFFIGGLVILAILIAFVYSTFMIEPVYETKTKIQPSNYEGLYSEPNTVVQLLSSTGLMKKVMSDLGVEMSGARLNSYINNNLTIRQIDDTSIISITVKNNEPQLTLNIAEGLINNFKNDSNQYFQNEIENDKEYIADLKNDLKDINLDLENNKEMIEESRNAGKLETVSLLIQENSSLQNSRRELRKEIKLLNFYSLEVISAPYLPENPVSPNTKLNIAIAGILGLMLAIFIVFLKEFIKNADLSQYE